jgi:hypothetical protein
MIRLALAAMACALLGALAASPVLAGSDPGNAEKQAAQQHAKRVLVRRARKAGIEFTTRDVSASCKRRTDFWSCRAKANTEQGVCDATMRLYNAAGPFHAARVRVGCAPPAPSAP